jgi:hypothetical protein
LTRRRRSANGLPASAAGPGAAGSADQVSDAGVANCAAATGVDRRMAPTGEWDRLLGEVGRSAGFEDFLPPRLDRLRPAASGGPVAVINVSRWRCDTLVITSQALHAAMPAFMAEPVPRAGDGPYSTEWSPLTPEVLRIASGVISELERREEIGQVAGQVGVAGGGALDGAAADGDCFVEIRRGPAAPERGAQCQSRRGRVGLVEEPAEDVRRLAGLPSGQLGSRLFGSRFPIEH